MPGLGCYFITPSSLCSTCWTVCENRSGINLLARYAPATKPFVGSRLLRCSIATRSSTTRPGLNVTDIKNCPSVGIGMIKAGLVEKHKPSAQWPPAARPGLPTAAMVLNLALRLRCDDNPGAAPIWTARGISFWTENRPAVEGHEPL